MYFPRRESYFRADRLIVSSGVLSLSIVTQTATNWARFFEKRELITLNALLAAFVEEFKPLILQAHVAGTLPKLHFAFSWWGL
jgi:hypothetical protein